MSISDISKLSTDQINNLIKKYTKIKPKIDMDNLFYF